MADTTPDKTKATTKKVGRTQAEADAALIAAYREKFGGETTATFEDGKPSEMGRAVRNNMFRCTYHLIFRSGLSSNMIDI